VVYFSACWTAVLPLQAEDLARVVVVCSWEKRFTLTVPLSIQMYNLMLEGNPTLDQLPFSVVRNRIPLTAY